jgi:hypothetical protein
MCQYFSGGCVAAICPPNGASSNHGVCSASDGILLLFRRHPSRLLAATPTAGVVATNRKHHRCACRKVCCWDFHLCSAQTAWPDMWRHWVALHRSPDVSLLAVQASGYVLLQWGTLQTLSPQGGAPSMPPLLHPQVVSWCQKSRIWYKSCSAWMQ